MTVIEILDIKGGGSVIRAIRNVVTQTGPNDFETRYETRDFDMPEFETFITWDYKYTGGYVGLEVRPSEKDVEK